ncbi:hypothetical protein C8Q75DRAFT_323200 [Abortiporus biennis]|nr:hypothetical protein C8Q75DRAFT_323200 [Abortiporus biennis]
MRRRGLSYRLSINCGFRKISGYLQRNSAVVRMLGFAHSCVLIHFVCDHKHIFRLKPAVSCKSTNQYHADLLLSFFKIKIHTTVMYHICLFYLFPIVTRQPRNLTLRYSNESVHYPSQSMNPTNSKSDQTEFEGGV